MRGLIEAHEEDGQKANIVKPMEVKSVTEYVNALLLQKAMNNLKPLLIEGFPDNWIEIYFGENSAVMEIPKKARDLDARLGLNLFPT